MTLTEARARLTAIESSIESGVLTVERGGRRITYADRSSMQEEADRLRRDIAAADGKPSIRIATWSGSK